MRSSLSALAIIILTTFDIATGFHPPRQYHRPTRPSSSPQTPTDNIALSQSTKSDNDNGSIQTDKNGDNKAMAFLRKVGRVGGAASIDFANAMGLDESPSGGTKSGYHEDGFKVRNRPLLQLRRDVACRFDDNCETHSLDARVFQNVRKSKAAYRPCTASGIIDDMSEPFPFTSSGSQWVGITDRVMGGVSRGSLSREIVGGRLANVLRGTVSLDNHGGFVQMATDLALDPSVDAFVDAGDFDGVELEIYCEGSDAEETFNVQ